MHLYLSSLCIPHEYCVFDGVAHELGKIIEGQPHDEQ